jgi:hypothetical protein
MTNDVRMAEDYRTSFALSELDRTIQYAFLRCLSPIQLIDRISTLDTSDDSTDYVYRLSQSQLARAELKLLLGAMTALAERSEFAPSKLKAKLDRTLLRLVRLLPSARAGQFAKPFVSHPRKARRQWAYSALRDKKISKVIAKQLFTVYDSTGDQEALQLIARNPRRIMDVGPEALLTNLDEEYWRARVVESVIVYDRNLAHSLSRQYPFECAHAIGRLEDKSLLAMLCALFQENQNSLEFLSIYAFALGKLQANDKLKELECYVSSEFGISRNSREIAAFVVHAQRKSDPG